MHLLMTKIWDSLSCFIVHEHDIPHGKRANLFPKAPIHQFDDVLSLFGRQRRNSWTRCNRCDHRCNIFMLWTGRVRAINSGGVGRVKEREKRNETRVGSSSRWGARGRGAERLRFPNPSLSRATESPAPPSTTVLLPATPVRISSPSSAPASPRASSHRTLYGARTTLFVCFQPVCTRTRRYAISVSGMRVTERTTDPCIMYRCHGKKKRSFGKSQNWGLLNKRKTPSKMLFSKVYWVDVNGNYVCCRHLIS